MLPDEEFFSLLPESELDTLLLTATDAVDLARDGEIAAGFRCLSVGLERAQEAEEDGEEWGPDLVRRYREARDRYTRAYGGRLLGEVC